MSNPRAIINLKNLQKNLTYLKSQLGDTEIYPVIKSGAYGHGFKQVAKELDKSDINGVCIATINELQDLIDLKVKYSILHLGKICFSDLKLSFFFKNIIFSISKSAFFINGLLSTKRCKFF